MLSSRRGLHKPPNRWAYPSWSSTTIPRSGACSIAQADPVAAW